MNATRTARHALVMLITSACLSGLYGCQMNRSRTATAAIDGEPSQPIVALPRERKEMKSTQTIRQASQTKQTRQTKPATDEEATTAASAGDEKEPSAKEPGLMSRWFGGKAPKAKRMPLPLSEQSPGNASAERSVDDF